MINTTTTFKINEKKRKMSKNIYLKIQISKKT
jgi:hypothetical protein